MSYNALFRELKDGKEYNNFFPAPNGNKVNLGKGNTNTSIQLIVKWALENNHEIKEVATKLQKSSLDLTCLSIHDFLFNHFQYKADTEDQLLRSPAYAWKYRYDGIDCKSSSVIASCILLQLGIKHYIRKIKQPAFSPENFTHVYVIVPVNQKSGSLDKGYYTIDGTLKTTIEPNYIEKKDFFMDKLQHYGLNGTQQGLNGFSYDDVKSLFSGIDCIGGSAYSDTYLKNNVKLMNDIFSKYIEDINDSVINNSSKIGFHVASFKGFSKMLHEAFKKSKADGWNSCSTNNFDATIKVTDFFMTTGGKALDAWLQQFFLKGSIKSTLVFKNYKSLTTGHETGAGFWGTSAGGAETITISEPAFEYSIKSGIEIPVFELNKYSLDSHKTKTFNPSSFLDTLSNVLVTVSGSNGTGSGSSQIDENGQVIYTNENMPKNTKNAGMAYLFGGLALTGFAVWGFSKMKDNPKTKK